MLLFFLNQKNFSSIKDTTKIRKKRRTRYTSSLSKWGDIIPRACYFFTLIKPHLFPLPKWIKSNEIYFGHSESNLLVPAQIDI